MNKRLVILCAVVAVLCAGGWMFWGRGRTADAGEKTARPFYGKIERSVSATGTVKPQNRLEIKPPIAGRIERILVKEGQAVKTGDVLAVMSSTERAALLDAARLEGDAALREWAEIYREAPLIASHKGSPNRSIESAFIVSKVATSRENVSLSPLHFKLGIVSLAEFPFPSTAMESFSFSLRE